MPRSTYLPAASLDAVLAPTCTEAPGTGAFVPVSRAVPARVLGSRANCSGEPSLYVAFAGS